MLSTEKQAANAVAMLSTEKQAVNAVAILSTGNVVLEKNVQGIWRAGLNWFAGQMRSLAAPTVIYWKSPCLYLLCTAEPSILYEYIDHEVANIREISFVERPVMHKNISF